MSRKTSSIIFSAAMVLGFASGAFADARISSSAGSVLVNRGVGYQPVLRGMKLRTGDRILVGQSGAGKLSFADGCVVTLVPGVMTIGASSPCQVKAQAGPGAGLGLGGGGGLGLGGAALGLGTIAVIGGLTLVGEKIQSDQEKKSSP